MDIFDEILDKAKVALDVAVKATGDVVDTGKQKFNIAALENKIVKDYKTIGELFYKQQKGNEINEEELMALVAGIDEKKAQIEVLKQEIKKAKSGRVCAACGAIIEENAVFCPICGQKLEFTTEE